MRHHWRCFPYILELIAGRPPRSLGCWRAYSAPYDIVGTKFLWWTRHDTNASIAARLFGAPVSSSLWVLTFASSFALLLDFVLRGQEITSKRFAVGLVLVAGLTTTMMVAQMTVLQTLDSGRPDTWP